jgi:hypothetical protein
MVPKGPQHKKYAEDKLRGTPTQAGHDLRKILVVIAKKMQPPKHKTLDKASKYAEAALRGTPARAGHERIRKVYLQVEKLRTPGVRRRRRPKAAK